MSSLFQSSAERLIVNRYLIKFFLQGDRRWRQSGKKGKLRVKNKVKDKIKIFQVSRHLRNAPLMLKMLIEVTP